MPRGVRRVASAADVGHTTLIAFAAGCSCRRRVEAWLGEARVVPERVMEFTSYHAMVACVAAGTGIAVVPRSVIAVSGGARRWRRTGCPADRPRPDVPRLAERPTLSVALDALRAQVRGRRRR